MLLGPYFLINAMKASEFELIKSSLKTLSLTLPEALWSGFKALCKAFSQNHLVELKGWRWGERCFSIPNHGREVGKPLPGMRIRGLASLAKH